MNTSSKTAPIGIKVIGILLAIWALILIYLVLLASGLTSLDSLGILWILAYAISSILAAWGLLAGKQWGRFLTILLIVAVALYIIWSMFTASTQDYNVSKSVALLVVDLMALYYLVLSKQVRTFFAK